MQARQGSSGQGASAASAPLTPLAPRHGLSIVLQPAASGPPGQPGTCLDALAHWASHRPDTVFLDFEGRLLTFGALADAVRRLAAGLAGLGIARGDRVATVMDNSDDLIVSFFAINTLGAIWVPVNTAYRGEFLRHQLADSGACLAICDGACAGNLLAIADDLPALATILLRDGAVPQAPPDRGLPGRVPALRVLALDDHRGADLAAPAALSWPVITCDDVACLMYTSGTTGPSKGCILTHGFLWSTASQRNRCVVPFAGIVTWSCLPLFHTAATTTVLLANLLAGERIAIASRFSVSGFWDEIERSGANSVSLLATMLPLIAHAPDSPAMKRCFGQIRVVTGVPLGPAERAIWEERFGVGYMMSFGYGQTEANMVAYLPWGAPLPPLSSMGPPAPEFDVMVVDDADRPLPVGQTGELVVRPTHPHAMFRGYWGRPADTLQAMRGLWWHTGDLVRMDAQGYLHFVDRKKDYLRSRGENISSFEVENAILRHDAIAEVACHAIPAAPGREEELKTTAVLRAGANLSERALFDWMLEHLPYFAVARFIEFRPALPKTPTGKVQKEVLRAEGCTGQTWDCEAHGLRVRRQGPRQ